MEDSETEQMEQWLNLPLAEQVFLVASDDVYRGATSPDWSVDKLPASLRVICLVEATLGKIGNGNLHYFFENDWPGNPPYSQFAEAFRAIGAMESADCIDDAVSAFGFENPHLDLDSRRKILYPDEGGDAHAADVIEQLGNRILDLEAATLEQARQYILQHIEHFPTVARFLQKYHPDAT
jgi:hypothetical protein